MVVFVVIVFVVVFFVVFVFVVVFFVTIVVLIIIIIILFIVSVISTRQEVFILHRSESQVCNKQTETPLKNKKTPKNARPLKKIVFFFNFGPKVSIQHLKNNGGGGGQKQIHNKPDTNLDINL